MREKSRISDATLLQENLLANFLHQHNLRPEAFAFRLHVKAVRTIRLFLSLFFSIVGACSGLRAARAAIQLCASLARENYVDIKKSTY